MACLDRYRRIEFSQHGEDGILEKIFELLKVPKGWCVELGAWDGKKNSNTCYLITKKKWSGVLIEANPDRFKELKSLYGDRPDVHCLRKFVEFEGGSSLDSLFTNTPMPIDFDLLSVDIDGNDYHLWESLNKYRPKVVIIEYNPTIPNVVSFIQPRDMSVDQGSSLLALVELAHKKGYELAAVTETNGIFVRKELYPLLGVEDNSLQKLRPHAPLESYLFQLYDGTLVVQGNKKLLWSGIPIKDGKIQVLPKIFRFYQSSNTLKRLLRRIWRAYYKIIYS